MLCALDKLLRYATHVCSHMCNDCHDFNVYGRTLFMAYCNRQFLFFSMNGVIAPVTNALALERAGRMASSGAFTRDNAIW